MNSSSQLQIVELFHKRDNLFIEHNQKIQELEFKYSKYIQEILSAKAKLLCKINVVYYESLNKINQELFFLAGGDTFKDIETNPWTTLNSNAQNTNNSVSIQSIVSSQISNTPPEHSDTSSVSSDESISSLEYESNNSNRNINAMNIDQSTDDDADDDDDIPKDIQSEVEYDLGSNEWLKNVLKNKRNNKLPNLSLSRNYKERITLDFSGFTDDKESNESITRILERMNMSGLFERCKHIAIISPPKSITKEVTQLIGTLSNIESVHFEGIPFFPAMKLLNKIPEHKQLQHLSLSKIEIKYSIFYPEIIETNVDEKEIDHIIGILFSCKSLTISKWSNPHRFWNEYIAKFKKKFTHSPSEITGALKDKMESCNLKKLEFFGGEPKEDDLPHVIMQLLFKHSASNLEILNVDFVDKNLYHACMPWLNQKNINKNLHFHSLKQFHFVWSDDRSINLLKIAAKTAQNLNKIILVLPKRDLLQKEKTLIKQLQKKTKVETLTIDS